MRRRYLLGSGYDTSEGPDARRPQRVELPANSVEKTDLRRAGVSCVCAYSARLYHLGRQRTPLRPISRLDRTLRRINWLHTEVYDLLSSTIYRKCLQRRVSNLLVRSRDTNIRRLTDDPISNDAIRNLVMDQASSTVFYRNYLSRMIRYDNQAICQGTPPRTQLIHSANRMSRLIDPRRPKDLTGEQRARIRQEAEIQELYGRRNKLSRRIRDGFKFIYRAKGQPIYECYKEAQRAVDRKIK